MFHRFGLETNEAYLLKSVQTWTDHDIKRISQLLLDPIRDSLLNQDPNHLLVFSPHLSLHSVPWAALYLDSKTRLIDKFAFSVVPSIQYLLVQTNFSESKECHTLIIGNKKPYVTSTGGLLMELPGAEEEAKSLHTFFSQHSKSSILLLNEQATIHETEKVVRLANFIHITMHGTLETEDFYVPGKIYFDHTPLFASTISKWSLKARLIFLNTCRSASGIITHDGILGLPRTFLHAGCSSVIAASQKIADSCGKEISTRFYRHLLASSNSLNPSRLEVAKALQQSILEVKEIIHYSSFSCWGFYSVIN